MTTDELINQKDVWLLAGASAERERIVALIRKRLTIPNGNLANFMFLNLSNVRIDVKDLLAEIEKGGR